MGATSTRLPDQRKSVTKATLDHDEGTLYRHTKRPEWGAAILAWEKNGRRAYQFEDGRLRKFQEGYYSLLQPADDVDRPREAIVQGLEEAVAAKRGKEPADALDAVAPFSAQVELFREMYPKGFQDENWIEEHRGDGPGRNLKRHRQPAIDAAQEKLSKERCDQLIADGKHSELVASVTDVLSSTSLVALKDVKPLMDLDDELETEFAEAVRELLHGEDHYGPRLKVYLAVMEKIYGKPPSWRIATALPALVYPDEHVCVRRSAFARQAGSIAPLAKYSKRAEVGPYKNYRRVAFAVRTRLQAENLEPRDMLDIHDFVWATLRNASLDKLDED